MVNAWKKTSLPTLLSNYDLKDFYNADEFNSNQKSIQSGKLVCITSIAAADTVGDKIPMFVIRKSQKPSCIKNVNFLPCRY